MTEENTEMATINETPKPEEQSETMEEMKPETIEEHKKWNSQTFKSKN